MKKIDFIIIGAQKAGSTFLYNLLQQHPEIEMPKSEITFFQEPDFSNIKNLDKEIEDLFRTKKLRGIKRPNYLGQPESPSLIENYGDGKIKLLVVLRDPVERFISAYFHLISMSWISPFFINRKINKILFKNYEQPVRKNLIEYGLYAKYCEKYIKTISNDNMLILDFNFLTKEPQKALDIVTNFLNIEKFTLNKSQVPKPVNVGAKTHLELTRRYLVSRLSYKFDREIQRLYVKESKTYINIMIIKFVNKIFGKMIKILKPKNIVIKDKTQEKIRMRYLEDQKSLKSFKIIK